MCCLTLANSGQLADPCETTQEEDLTQRWMAVMVDSGKSKNGKSPDDAKFGSDQHREGSL